MQYLRSLSQSGVADLPTGNDETASQLEKSMAATREFLNSRPAESTVTSVPSAETGMAQTTGALDSTPPMQPVMAEEESVRSPAVGSSDQGTSASSPNNASSNQASSSQTLTKPDRLKILADEVGNCFACPELVSNRTQTVFGVGDPQARLCFMGEAPGADEDVQGEPFVGAAGQLLDRIIAACRMKREDVYILNTLKCRPPNNRNPTDEECANCRPFLNQQLEIIQPEYICCLGGIAAKHLLESPLSVGRLRGKVHLYNGIKVVVTYHPAYLLRNPDAKRQVWNDMKFLMAEMGHDIT